MRLSLLILALLLTACSGWQLRGNHAIGGSVPPIRVVSADTYAPMALSLEEALERQDEIDIGGAPYVLKIVREDVDRRPVTFTATGTPAQYEMTLTVTYSLQPPDSTEPSLPSTASAHRLYDFDARNVVAKSEEERALLLQMRQQVAQRLIAEASRHYNDQQNANGD